VNRVRIARVVALSLVLSLLLAPVAAYADDESDLPTETPTTMPPAVTPSALTPVATTGPAPAPVIVIRSCGTLPPRVVPGVPFDLTITIYNATGRRADNVVVSLGQAATSAGATTPTGLTVLDTGNAKYLGLLKGQHEAAVTFSVIATPGMSPGAISVPVVVSFEHQSARQEVAYTVGLLVERDATLSLAAAELPSTVIVGETFDASFEIANSSAFALSGVSLSVEATGAAVTDGTIFIGTMDAATTEALDVSITPEKAGSLEVAVIVTYRDDYGRQQTFREVRSVQVDAVPEEASETLNGDKPEESDNWFVAFIKALFGLGS